MSSSEPESEDEPDLGEEEFEIEYIKDSRFTITNGRQILEYLIYWKGYEEKDRSWTLASQFDDDDPPVVAFYENYPNKPRKGLKTPLKGDLRDWFGKATPGHDKENVAITKKEKEKVVGKSMKIEKKMEKEKEVGKAVKKERKRKVESDESDFVMEENDKDEEDEDLKSDVDDEAEVQVDEDDDLESVDGAENSEYRISPPLGSQQAVLT